MASLLFHATPVGSLNIQVPLLVTNAHTRTQAEERVMPREIILDLLPLLLAHGRLVSAALWVEAVFSERAFHAFNSRLSAGSRAREVIIRHTATLLLSRIARPISSGIWGTTA